MLEAIRDFVTRHITAAAPATEESTPAAAGGGHRVAIAACALLLELAYADDEFSAAERAHIESALTRHFGLDDATAQELLALADQERRQAVDHFQFTRLITEHFDLGQRMVLAEVMWGVILADGHIASHESSLLRKLARLLALEPGYLAQARRRAEESG